jgi:hypothetical protein
MLIEFSWLKIGPVAGFCKNNDKLSGSIRGRELIE